MRIASVLLAIQIINAAEMPRVGRVVVFGDTQLESRVRALLPPAPFDMTEDDGDRIDKALKSSPEWRRSDMTWVCCEPGGTAILYVGVREAEGGPRFRPAPAGNIGLDADELALYDRLMALNHEAVTKGLSGAEDTSAGHSRSSYGPARELQEQAILRASHRITHWRLVALESSYAKSRAAAVHLAAYGPKDEHLTKVLEAAARDPDTLVRNNAVRAIGVVMRSEAARTRVRIDPMPLIELFHSVHWTDWNKASFALMALTEESDPRLLAQIAERASGPLRQISRWPPMHATPARVILERIAAASGK